MDPAPARYAIRIHGHLGATVLGGLAHGYDTAFWWIAGIFAGGAVVSGVLLRPGPLGQKRTPFPAPGGAAAAQAAANREQVR